MIIYVQFIIYLELLRSKNKKKQVRKKYLEVQFNSYEDVV